MSAPLLWACSGLLSLLLLVALCVMSGLRRRLDRLEQECREPAPVKEKPKGLSLTSIPRARARAAMAAQEEILQIHEEELPKVVLPLLELSDTEKDLQAQQALRNEHYEETSKWVYRSVDTFKGNHVNTFEEELEEKNRLDPRTVYEDSLKQHSKQEHGKPKVDILEDMFQENKAKAQAKSKAKSRSRPQTAEEGEKAPPPTASKPVVEWLCPLCDSSMLVKTAGRGGISWACPTYPQCRGTRSLAYPSKASPVAEIRQRRQRQEQGCQ